MSDSHSHGVSDLVISCMDYRFRERVAKWIEEELNNQADLVSVAGASKAVFHDDSKDFVLSLLKIGRDLHGVKTVHILAHMDCGAYGGSKQHADEEAEHKFHKEKLAEAVKVIKDAYPELTVKTYTMTFDEIIPVK